MARKYIYIALVSICAYHVAYSEVKLKNFLGVGIDLRHENEMLHVLSTNDISNFRA